nr:uncharacterized protein LOC111988161 [Quercus suber]
MATYALYVPTIAATDLDRFLLIGLQWKIGALWLEVEYIYGGRYGLDLNERTCGCGRWGLSRISCFHSVAAIIEHGEQLETYVDIACRNSEIVLKAVSLATPHPSLHDHFVKDIQSISNSFRAHSFSYLRRQEITRSKRHLPPTHYMLKIESYSILSETVEKYESGVFEAGGHKWRLSLYPKGNKKMNGSGHISLYLAIVETENLPRGWEICVNFKLLVFDQIRDKYLTIHDADDSSIKRFHDMKTEWGFTKFLPLDTFNDVSHGYLVNDCCLFGVEVFVHKHSGKLECVSITEKPANCTLTWKIEKFSALDEESYSQEFTVADSQWKILVYPKGNSNGKAKAISVYLCSCNCLVSDLKYFAEFKLRIRDQINKNHVENTAKHWFSKSLKDWGFSQFLLLENLNDASKGFLVNDTLIVEAEIMAVSNIKLFA